MTARRAALLVALAAVVPYLPTLDNYFVQDDFGVVALLSSKPATYFPRWFVSTWMDDIWGYTPDEIRPFPAVSYQMAAIFGAASPVANHVVNIGFHAVNAVLVLAVAAEAAGLALAPATFAALVFAVLPMQTESVAWVTGRVDSMPACFFLAAFLCFARWRVTGRAWQYWWAVAWCAVALLTKQNTVILGPCLVAFDLVVRRQPPRFTWEWMRPYLPFALLTLAYLALRYVLFGEVARESTLNARQFAVFTADLAVHLKRMVYGEPGVAAPGLRVAAWVAGAGLATAAYGAVAVGRRAAPLVAVAVFFGVVWIGLSVAPTLVAGYASPRHMYLAAVGWAVLLAVPCQLGWEGGRGVGRWVTIGAAAAVLGVYAVQLRGEVAAWDVRADVSRRAVLDLTAEAERQPPGALVLAGVPRRSFDFAVPHALRPPFTTADLTARLRVVTHSSLHCCPANLWEPHTRALLRAWLDDPSQPPVVVLHWHADTGALTRVDDTAQPFVRALVPLLAGTRDVASLDSALLDVIGKLTGGDTRRLR
ncbi:MAG: hypothetical protein AB7H93_10815 [Vicinamibacterales bacterium]